MHPRDPLGRGSSCLGGRRRRHWARPPGMVPRLSAPARRRGGPRGALCLARPARREGWLRHGRGRRGAARAGRPVPDRKPGSRSCAGGLGPRLPFRPQRRSARWRRPLRCARSGAKRGGAELPSLSGPAAAAVGGPVTWGSGGGAAVCSPPPALERERGPAMGLRRAPAPLPALRRAGAPRAGGAAGFCG